MILKSLQLLYTCHGIPCDLVICDFHMLWYNKILLLQFIIVCVYLLVFL